MNIYKTLNEITLYIDNHLKEKIDYEVLARMMGVNAYTMQRIFSVITGITLAEYIRKRKLSCAAYDLMNSKVKIMDIAIKYGYDNATSFSRAFKMFHGIKPSEVNNNSKIKEFPRLTFEEKEILKQDIEYTVEERPNITLYGTKTKVNNDNIRTEAPLFFQKIENRYKNNYGNILYGMTTYKDIERKECDYYWVLYDKNIPNFEKIEVPKSRWLKFSINSQNAKDIQDMVNKFYYEFLPSCKYNLKDIEELEYYHDNITDFYIPIY